MIIRKPYAILIKNFKLIHAILTACMIYLVYKTYGIFSYIGEYMKTNMLAVGEDLTAVLFDVKMFWLAGIVTAGLVVMLGIMIRKKKPFLFYVVNIIIYIATLGVYSYLYDTINFIEGNIIEMTEMKLAYDIAMMLMFAQGISMILSFVRAIGFDYKKFDFGKDLMELDIQEDDDEEVEVSVNIETNVLQRGVNRKKRFAKYVYLENKFAINVLIFLAISLISFVIYLNTNVYNVVYNEGDMFLAYDLEMGVLKSYIIENDYRGKKIVDDGEVIIALETNIKAFNRNQSLTTAKTILYVDGIEYYPDEIESKDAIFDLGNTYYDGVLDYASFQKVLLVYSIPKNDRNKEMTFKYINEFETKKGALNPKYINVNLKPIKIDEKQKKEKVKLGEEIILNEFNLGATKLKINKVELKEEFVLNYKFCITTDDCYQSVEYLRAPLANTKDLALLRVNATLELDEEIDIERIYTPYSVINLFGSIVYEKDGKKYTLSSGFEKVEPTKIKSGNNYYIALNKDVLDAETITLIIKIRNKTYEYKIK